MRPRRALLAAALALLPALAAAQGSAGGNDPSFSLVNRSGQVIREIYVSAVTQSNWGADLLGDQVLQNGRSFPVRIAPAQGCRQDVRVVYADGRPDDRRNVDTCALREMVFGTATPAPAAGAATANPSFNLVNQGAQPLREVYVSSAQETNWGDQRLRQPMQPGAHLPVQLRSGDCVNDVRVIWADGRAEERRAVNTCQMVNMVFR